VPTWSQDEINRTIDEVKRRASTDPNFRRLALADAFGAIARVNPKPVPSGTVFRFVESVAAETRSASSELLVVLPALTADSGGLSESDLEQAAGGVNELNKLPDRNRES
jgi:hypothetical protein